MHLKKITLKDFRNISAAELEFSRKINCLSGNNGAGKTNLLDAIYYLSMTKSFFSSSDRYTYRFGCEEAIASGLYVMDDGQEERISLCVRKNGEKQVKRGGKAYERFSEHIGLLPVVMVSPSDVALIYESGEERRKYMNFMLSQMDKVYLQHIQSYNKLLARRNAVLKDDFPSDLLLETISEQMIPHADYIYNARKELCVSLMPEVSALYSGLSSGGEKVSVEYRSDLDETSLDRLFAADAVRDKQLHYTSSGVQRDEISFILDGHPIRRCGSQGQQKTFLLALKLAQFFLMKRKYGVSPLLLLDDVFDKLDMSRVGNLLSIVADDDFGQIFITDSNKVRISSIVESFSVECADFFVEGGVCSRTK